MGRWAAVVHGPFLYRTVDGARSGLQALSPPGRGKEVGQEPEHGLERSHLSPPQSD